MYFKTYHKQFVPYYETYGKLIFYNIPVGATGIEDYSLNLVNNYDNTNDSQLQLKLQNLININTLGIQQQILNIDYQEINTKTGLNLTTDISVARQVHIINTRCLPFDSSGLNSIKLDDNNTKFNLIF